MYPGAAYDGIENLEFVPSTRIAFTEFGVGFGLTDASDKVTLKLILSGDFSKGHIAK